MPDFDSLTDTVLSRCNEMAQCSDEVGRITRTFLQPSMHRAHGLLAGWMREAGLTVRRDAIGNMIGRRSGRSERVFAVGSHIDTVINAGKYDGVLGVLLGVAAAQALSDRPHGRTLDVIAFSEEEGVRFATPYLGSRAVCGSSAPEMLDRIGGAERTSLAQTIRDFGLDPAELPKAAYPEGSLTGYIEAHIEQGPVLESLDASLGVVSDIAGQSRRGFHFLGQAGHAGTQPMELRRDALAAAAEFVGVVERLGRTTPGLRATVGRFMVRPGATNVVPGEVHFSLDVRHADDSIRTQALRELLEAALSICSERNINCTNEPPMMEQAAVACDRAMTQRLAGAVKNAGFEPHALVSGAGHDAVIMATRCPVAMLFLRSPGGISHHPDESVRRDDVRAALEVMVKFLEGELDLE